MFKILRTIPPAVFVLAAVLCEVAGDALIRKCIYNYTGTARILLFISGALLVFCYGFLLNLAPVEFGDVVGLYIAFLFIVWQIGNYIAFRQSPSVPIIAGGALIVTGGLIIAFWKR